MNVRTGRPAAASRGGWVRRPPLRYRIALCVGVLCVSSAVAGCAAAPPAALPMPPVPVLSPSPIPDPTAPYVIDGLAETALATAPGQPMVVGMPVGVRSGSVILVSATLLPLAGYPLPELAGVGVVTGSGYLVAGWDWPPRTTPTPAAIGSPGTLPVLPLAGYVLSTGRPGAIYYAMRGSHDGGTYYAAGLRLVYRTAAGDRTVDLYQVGVDCVVADFPQVNPQCSADPVATGRIAALGS
jgi:hypothetical protein